MIIDSLSEPGNPVCARAENANSITAITINTAATTVRGVELPSETMTTVTHTAWNSSDSANGQNCSIALAASIGITKMMSGKKPDAASAPVVAAALVRQMATRTVICRNVLAATDR